MSKKVRIHDLAKQYAMSGKDLAAKLRDFGFSKAKSHMSALDDFELVQAEGLLHANGILPSSGGEEGHAEDDAGGGLIIRRKKKKPKADDTPAAAAPAPAPIEPQPAPQPDPVAAAEPEPAAPAEEPVAEAPAATPATTSPAPGPVEEPAAVEQPPADSTPEPVVEAPAPEPEPAVQESPAAASAEAAQPAPAEAPSEPEAAAPEPAPAEAPSPAPAPAAGASEATKPAASAPAASSPAPAADGAPAAAAAATGEGASAEAAKAPEAGADAKKEEPGKPNRKGNVIGFIDPSTFQQANAGRPRSQSRRLLSKDDVAPDVRPTFGRGRGQAHTGPRGNLTAAQLREREQGRFLRRNRQQGAQGRRSGRSGPRQTVTDSPLAGSKATIDEPITMSKLGETLKLKAQVIIKAAFQSNYGYFNLNSVLDSDTAILLASEFEVELEVREDVSAEEQLLEEVRAKRSEIEDSKLVDRPPTVAFLGHVDHGKTTLIDKIRATKVADGEDGGITQHTSAYQVTTKAGHKVTIIDTPGHAAFTSMRARGAQAVDIVVLVVAGDDGVKPSTEEAIVHAEAAGTPIIVALNKKDKAGFNANAAIQQLMGKNLVPEQYGGQTAMIETSAITGEGIDDLLEQVHLMGELELALKAHPKGPASGVVLEAEVHQGRGKVTHLLVQDGTLKKGDILLAGEGYGKVKSIQNDRGKTVKEAGPSMPIAVLGLDELPGVGDKFFVIDSLSKAKEVAQEKARKNRAIAMAGGAGPNEQLAAILGKEGTPGVNILSLIVRADVQGSVEVLRSEIEALMHEEVKFKVVHAGVGAVTESDVDLASATDDTEILAFHVGVAGKVKTMADRKKVPIRKFQVIYELIDYLKERMEGSLSPDLEEVVVGHVEIKALFKSSRIGVIAGCQVLDGTIHRNHKVRLLRDDRVVWQGELQSLRRESEDVREVREGFECGVVLRDYRDIREGDVIETYEVNEVKRVLNI